MAIKLISFLLFFIMACGPVENSSDLNYIVNPRSYSKLKGLYKKPRVCIKGPYANAWKSLILRGLYSWQYELRKIDSDVVTSATIDCVKPDYLVETLSSYGRAHASSNGRIRLYRNTTLSTIVHEFGHAYAGLSDTYVEGIWTCKKGQPVSIMCTTRHGSSLLNDDIRGIRKVYREFSTLDKPTMIMKKTIARLARVQKCPRLSLFIHDYTSGLNYSNGHPSRSYARAKIGQEEINMAFPYYLSSGLVYHEHANDLWQQIQKTKSFQSICI